MTNQVRIPFSITPSSVIVMLNGKTYALTQDSHQHYATIRQALKDKDFATVEKLIDLAQAINDFGGGKIRVVNGVVMYGDHELHNSATRRLLEQMAEGFDVEPMVKFLENVMQNPSKRAVDELYTFLEFNSLPITEDGHFVAYKRVNSNFKDFYTGRMDNSIGRVVEMARNFVNDDKDQTCSTGLHFCSLSYLPHYHSGEGRIVIVKINPADVVSIPSDYNNAKGRACKYLILEEYLGGELNEKFNTSIYGYTPEADDVDAADEETVECWNCGASMTEEERRDNDGDCPNCGVEISVDDSSEDYGFFDSSSSSSEDLHIENEDEDDVEDEADEVAVEVTSTVATATSWPFPTGPAHPAELQPGLTPAQVQAQPQPQGVLYTKEQAAQILGIGLDALRKRLDRGVVRVNINGHDLVRFV
jgi:predicted RNA-binding Zn-ribbon protein involved in translation (DUF1610 family)